MTDRLQELLARVTEIGASPLAARRRSELTEIAESAGLNREFADQAYELATETGLDPGLAFAVILSGIGVRELGHPAPDASTETQVEAPPPWVNAAVAQPDDADRQRLLRSTFRRLQSLVESCPDWDAALEAFVKQPDVDVIAYN